MLRIEIHSENASTTLLSLAGKLSADHLPELGRLLEDALGSGRRVGLDLGAVTLVDRASLAFLAGAAGRGAGLKRCPTFVREWIRREAEEQVASRAPVTAENPHDPRDLGSRPDAPQGQGVRP
jgi:ABC-type transporter Mla MlaB component